MRRTALQRLAVLHHRLDGVRVQRTGETLRLRLHTLNDGDGEPFLSEFGIHLHHLLGVLLSLLAGSVSRMSLLPQELRRTQERTRAHLPAHHVTPLVTLQGQVAPRLNPVLIRIPYNRL